MVPVSINLSLKYRFWYKQQHKCHIFLNELLVLFYELLEILKIFSYLFMIKMYF